MPHTSIKLAEVYWSITIAHQKKRGFSTALMLGWFAFRWRLEGCSLLSILECDAVKSIHAFPGFYSIYSASWSLEISWEDHQQFGMWTSWSARLGSMCCSGFSGTSVLLFAAQNAAQPQCMHKAVILLSSSLLCSLEPRGLQWLGAWCKIHVLHNAWAQGYHPSSPAYRCCAWRWEVLEEVSPRVCIHPCWKSSQKGFIPENNSLGCYVTENWAVP